MTNSVSVAPLSADTRGTRFATRMSFFAAGFVMACWAPLVPYAKANVGADAAELGMLLLCLGAGSIVAMPLTGWISARVGSKPMILTGGLGLVLMLPLLSVIGSPLLLALALLLFGASLGTMDVAMNIHASEVEKAAERPLMSGFHGMFSVGGVAGAGGITLLLSQGASPHASALCGSALALAAILLAWPRLLQAQAGEGPAFVAPRGIVLLLAALSGIVFLVEGTILDWGALLLLGRDLIDSAAQGGLAYLIFSVAMTAGRLTGDRVVSAFGDLRVLVGGGLLTIAGFVLLLAMEQAWLALMGLVLIGFGAANLVPVLFSRAGRQTAMPTGLAVAAVTTTGYAGILAGPALMGFVSEATSLPTAFWLVTALMVLVPLFARAATRA